MGGRVIIVGVLLAASLLWVGPFAVSNWTVVALLLLVVSLGVVLSVKRMRTEQRLVRTIWNAITRK